MQKTNLEEILGKGFTFISKKGEPIYGTIFTPNSIDYEFIFRNEEAIGSILLNVESLKLNTKDKTLISDVPLGVFLYHPRKPVFSTLKDYQERSSSLNKLEI